MRGDGEGGPPAIARENYKGLGRKGGLISRICRMMCGIEYSRASGMSDARVLACQWLSGGGCCLGGRDRCRGRGLDCLRPSHRTPNSAHQSFSSGSTWASCSLFGTPLRLSRPRGNCHPSLMLISAMPHSRASSLLRYPATHLVPILVQARFIAVAHARMQPFGGRDPIIWPEWSPRATTASYSARVRKAETDDPALVPPQIYSFVLGG